MCLCDDRRQLEAAYADIVAHNAERNMMIGERSRDTFRSLDPMRAYFTEKTGVVVDGLQAWSRGNNIETCVLLLRFAGRTWLETVNDAGGADSTEWFDRRFAGGSTSIQWFGTRGKPLGFNDPSVIVVAQGPLSKLCEFKFKLPENNTAANAFVVESPIGSARFQLVDGCYTSERTGRCGSKSCDVTHKDDGSALDVCAGCGVAQYCSKLCQRAAWKTHKPLCHAPT